MYGKSWACPPAVGPVRECQERCKSYSGALLITTVSEVQDISDLEETLATRAPHEEITRQASHVLKEEAEGVSVLSAESCAFCQASAYPEGNPAAIQNVCSPAWKAVASLRQILPSSMESSISQKISTLGSLSYFIGNYDVYRFAKSG